MPLNVLHIYKSYFPETQGGLEETIRQICRGTLSHDVKSSIWTLAPVKCESIIKESEFSVIRCPRHFNIASCGISLTAMASFRKHAAAADIVHYHFPWPFADLMHLANRIRVPSVVTYHSDIVRQRRLESFYAPLMHRFLGQVSTIVATSPNYAYSSEVLKKFSDKVETIPIGMDFMECSNPSSLLLDHLRDKVGGGFFLFVGVLRYYKGLNFLLDAVAGTDLPVVIAGSGPEERNLIKQAKDLNLNNVKFLGQVSDTEKAALYHLCRAIVFPSSQRSEAYGVTLVEGAMHSKPLISTELGTGTSYVNLHEETGLVVPSGDSLSLRVAMNTLNNNSLVETMGAAARKRYERLFTGAMMGDRYADLYHRLSPKR